MFNYIDSLCLTWFDQILNTGRVWPICTGYVNKPKSNESYTDFLKRTKPIIYRYRIKKPILEMELFNFVDNILNDAIGIPLFMLSVGPTEVDKII